MEFYYASFGLCEKFVRGCPPTQMPTQKLKIPFLRFNSPEIGSSLISSEMVFEALQSEIFRFKFHFLGSKLQKIPEFNLYYIIYKSKYLLKKIIFEWCQCNDPSYRIRQWLSYSKTKYWADTGKLYILHTRYIMLFSLVSHQWIRFWCLEQRKRLLTDKKRFKILN